MDVLLIGESHLTLSVRAQLVSSVVSNARFHLATNPFAVAHVHANQHIDVVVSDFQMEGIHEKEWPGHLYAWFADAPVLLMCQRAGQVERLHDVLLDRARFIMCDMSCSTFIAHLTEVFAKVQEQGHRITA